MNCVMETKQYAWPDVFTVPKVDGQPNEDRYQSSRRGVHALSDGASVSFDSASWAQILVGRYAQNPEVTRQWIGDAITEFGRLYDRESMPWMKQASFDRGTFASLLGVRIVDEGKNIQVLSIGDTLAVLCKGDSISSNIPYVEPGDSISGRSCCALIRRKTDSLTSRTLIFIDLPIGRFVDLNNPRCCA